MINLFAKYFYFFYTNSEIINNLRITNQQSLLSSIMHLKKRDIMLDDHR